MVYQSHKSNRCISKSKRYNQSIIQTIFSFKGSFFKSILKNILELCNSSNMSSNIGIECQYFTVMLLVSLQSTHIRQILSFLIHEG